MNIKNKAINYNYEIIDSLEAGIELIGAEVKSIKRGNANINESFCRIIDKQIYIINFYIKPYENTSFTNIDSLRKRKLLIHKKQIIKWEKILNINIGYTIIPKKIYLKNRLIKLSICLVKGRKKYDKRELEKKKTMMLEVNKFNKMIRKF